MNVWLKGKIVLQDIQVVLKPAAVASSTLSCFLYKKPRIPNTLGKTS